MRNFKLQTSCSNSKFKLVQTFFQNVKIQKSKFKTRKKKQKRRLRKLGRVEAVEGGTWKRSNCASVIWQRWNVENNDQWIARLFTLLQSYSSKPRNKPGMWPSVFLFWNANPQRNEISTFLHWSVLFCFFEMVTLKTRALRK